MKNKTFNQQLMSFLESSPTPFHAVSNMSAILEKNGFQRLHESEPWSLSSGKYYVTRNDSSIIAFINGRQDTTISGIRMVGAHTDSPCLRVKPNPEKYFNGYLNLGVEVYGGALLNPWFDRDLSLAGRVTYQMRNSSLKSKLVNFSKPVATIPSLAIHLDRDANNKRNINPQRDIPPLILRQQLSSKDSAGKYKSVTLEEILIKQLKAEYKRLNIKKIQGYELSFYDTNPPAMLGINDEFIASARLDNLLSCYVGLMGLLDADDDVTSLLVCNDHEEVGSASAEGAQGPFLATVLQRVIPDSELRHRTIAKSLLISTDNAHGIHPNYSDRHDSNHGPLINQGPVIKINTNQRYATNSETSGYFSTICDEENIPCQTFVVRTDMACGSTIGPLTAKEIGVKTIDVGVPTFAMHSIRELAGSDDAHYLYTALKRFFRDTGNLGTAS